MFVSGNQLVIMRTSTREALDNSKAQHMGTAHSECHLLHKSFLSVESFIDISYMLPSTYTLSVIIWNSDKGCLFWVPAMCQALETDEIPRLKELVM